MAFDLGSTLSQNRVSPFFPVEDGIVHFRLPMKGGKELVADIPVRKDCYISPCISNSKGEPVYVTGNSQEFLVSNIFKEIKHGSRAKEMADSRMATVYLLYWIDKKIRQGFNGGYLTHPKLGTWFVEFKKPLKQEEPEISKEDWDFDID